MHSQFIPLAAKRGAGTEARRHRPAAFVAAAATAFLLALSGLSVPVAAQAIDQPGDWILEKKYSGDPQFPADAPHGVAVDRATGDIVFTDRAKSQLIKLDRNGDLIFRVGDLGNGNGFFNEPTGVAVDKQGNIYVADTANHRIQKFSSGGQYLLQWGEPGSNNGQFKSPHGLAVDSFGNVLVADTGNHRIQKFTTAGTYTGKWGSLGGGEKQFDSPEAIAVDPAGNIVVADTLNHRVQAFSYNGAFLRQWGTKGVVAGNFDQPRGIFVDHLNYVYVADSGNKRVQKFTAIGQFLSLFNTGTEINSLGVGLHPETNASSNSDSIYVTSEDAVAVYRQAASPAFVTAPRHLATVGKPYNSTVVTKGIPSVPVLSISGGKLPAGYALNGHTISGTTRVPGIYKVTLVANNNVESSAVSEFMINVRKAATKVWASGTKTKTSKKGTVTIRTNLKVAAPGTVGLTRSGKFAIYYGNKLVKTVTLYKSHNGVRATTLPKFKKSKRATITIRYLGNGQLRPSKAILGKAVTKLSVKLSDKTPKAKRTNIKATIKLRPSYAGSAPKTGTFKVYFGKKAVKTFTMKATHEGTIKVRLPKIRKTGESKITVRYLGNAKLMSSAKSVKVVAH